ncbi:MAG: uroporphyrinogen III methyltransferase [Phycisphaerae bacterium]|nr:MAG: uroporphyrinogen III methyltransferase [Phycisphaerae bacterium]
MKPRGTVYLVGAGPGDPSLITLRGAQLLKRADVVIYDRLASTALLAMCRPDVLKFDVGKTPGSGGHRQVAISALLVEHAKRGMCVVRLKGGDPGVFGRACEEQAACLENGIPCVIVPGVSSCLAAPASIGLATTRRGCSRSFTVLTARGSDGSGAEGLDYAKLVRDETLIVMMGRQELAAICYGLIEAGGHPNLPVACVERATMSQQRQCHGTLENIAATVEREGLQSPMVTIIGELASLNHLVGEIACSPLLGKKVAVTGSEKLCAKLSDELMSRGAEPIRCPLIRIDFTPSDSDLDEAIKQIDRYDWVAFTSANGVRGFFQRFSVFGKDSRALAHCRIASVGEATSRELIKQGVRADIQSEVETGPGLAAAIIEASPGTENRILLPRSDRALKTLPDRLESAGMQVTQVTAHRTVPVSPPDGMVDQINRSADAILFASPSAVRCAVDVGLCTDGKTVVCIGETTAAAAKRVEMKVNAVAEQASAESMVDSLEVQFQSKINSSGAHA